MNRTEKIKALQNALQGESGQLLQLYQERRKKAMPYREVHGIIDAANCPAILLDLPAQTGKMWMKAVEEAKPQTMVPLRECLCQMEEYNRNQKYSYDSAMSCIDADDSRYDAVKVNFIKITTRSKWIYQRDVTIGDLRAFHNQSEESFRLPFAVLAFEQDMSQYEWQMNRNKIKPA